ncbi:MAG TPA: endonuclease/exonuclease/phosphatase family protein [Povalibacter sp.]|uniref:endonuclease/exonuclease/phosphatase family protein n=1 Tax=Povalibacter sp. TaxID=1962978 RepID=UPI002CB8033A|nr:endonuclease/exonuclease/phosphatase family protein [Povalibacter sp.]HMN43549.1 endonuclease/exonuclease/phosphatase family protein [Povalibacter sp.]
MNIPRPRHPRPSTAATQLIALIVAGVLLAFGLGLFGRHFWVLDLFAHFRVQYTVVLVVCGLGLFMLRHLRSAAFVLAAAAAMAISILGYTGWPSQEAQAATGGFRFVTFNRYFHNDDFASAGQWLQKASADVIAFQEIDSPQDVQQLAAVLPQYPHVYADLNAESDVAIFSRWPIRSSERIELVPQGAQVAKTVIDWNGQPITLIGAHLHWPMGARNTRLRNAELRELITLARATEGPLLIGGDFNITPWSPVFREAMAGSGLTDCARGHGFVPSWPSWFAPAGIRIDHCLASDHWRVLDLSAGPSLGSDHLAMINDLELKR